MLSKRMHLYRSRLFKMSAKYKNNFFFLQKNCNNEAHIWLTTISQCSKKYIKEQYDY